MNAHACAGSRFVELVCGRTPCANTMSVSQQDDKLYNGPIQPDYR